MQAAMSRAMRMSKSLKLYMIASIQLAKSICRTATDADSGIGKAAGTNRGASIQMLFFFMKFMPSCDFLAFRESAFGFKSKSAARYKPVICPRHDGSIVCCSYSRKRHFLLLPHFYLRNGAANIVNTNMIS